MHLLYLILVYFAKACYLWFITKPILGHFNRISYQFEFKYATFYVIVMRFSDVTDYFLQAKSENVGYGNSRVEFPYPTSIQMKDTLSLPD
jgi:hypothetical protein